MTDLTGDRGWLADGPAASVHRIDAQLGRRLQISDAGRASEREWYLWNLYFVLRNGKWIARPASQRPGWLGKPGYPGTSPHGRGEAIDTDDHRGQLAVLVDHGWRRTVMPTEPWHFVYYPQYDNHRNAPAGNGTTTPTTPTQPTTEDADMRIFSTPSDGKFYLAKPTGIVHIASVADLQLLRRLLDSKAGAEPGFNEAERDIINNRYLRA